jgi:hypothetical protein
LVSIEGRGFAFGARKLLRFDLPGRIDDQNAFLGQPGKEHPDRGHMLLNSCRRARVLFDLCRHRDRLNILKAAEAGALAPIQELANGMIVSDPRVLVPDGNRKKIRSIAWSHQGRYRR